MSTTAVQVYDGPAPEDAPGTAVAVVRHAPRLLRPVASPKDIIQAQEETRALVTEALKQGRDYGTVKGIDKPFLFKAGAERLTLGMGCMYGEPRIIEKEIDHDRVVRYTKRSKRWLNRHAGDKAFEWEEKPGESQGLYRYVIAVPIIHRESGQVVAEGIGSCSTMESKYVDRPRDSENTALKMAHKRAVVAATLLAFGLSDQFTQDEDAVEPREHDGDARGAGSTGSAAAAPAANEPEAVCPKCNGKMWDNRAKKSNPKAPDFKCRDRSCDGVFWPGQWPPKPPDPAQGDLLEEDAPKEAQAPTSATKDPLAPRKDPADLRFPRSRQFPSLSGQRLGDLTTSDLERALRYAHDKGATALADAIADVLAGREGDGVPTALQDESDDLPF